MFYRSFRYYHKTLWLKSSGLVLHLLNKSALLVSYKQKNEERFSKLYDENFLSGVMNDQGKYTDQYIGYGYVIEPEDIAQHLMFNKAGIAVKRYDVRLNYYNPVITSWYGLVCYNHYILKNNVPSLSLFWKQVQSLEAWGEQKGDCFWLYNKVKIPGWPMEPPWPSGLTQALALSVFLRAWKESGDAKWKRLSQQVFHTFSVGTQQGGVLSDRHGEKWIEEYPAPADDRVLNGFLFSLIAIYEYIHLIDHRARNIQFLHSLVASLFKNLHRYLYGRFTKYSLRKWQFGNIEYQVLVTCLLFHLYSLSGKDAFRCLAEQYAQNTEWSLFYSFFQINRSDKEDIITGTGQIKPSISER